MTDTNEWSWQARYVEPVADADLAQGDLVDAELSGVRDRFTRSRWFVVLNQSCDLARQQKVKNISLLVPQARSLLVAPAIPMKEYFAEPIKNGRKLSRDDKFAKILWWNHDWAAYFPPGPGLDVDLVVVLEELYTLQAYTIVDGLPDLGGYDEVVRARILGLASPWAERLGWMVGRQFARVGTPDPPVDEQAALVAAVAERTTRP